MTDEPRATNDAPLRVLVVDDAPDLRLLVSFVLSSSTDYEVVGEAGDGAEAIEVATRLRPDLVMLDLSMPGMDGLEALPHLLELRIMVVVLSGFTRQTMTTNALRLGALGYLEKGAKPDQLLTDLEEILTASTSVG